MADAPMKGLGLLRLAGLPAAHAGRTALGLGRRLVGRPAELVAAEVQGRTAAQLFQTLGELKGGAMKLGQALSAMEPALPVELAGPYREAFTPGCRRRTSAADWGRARRVLAEDLGND